VCDASGGRRARRWRGSGSPSRANAAPHVPRHCEGARPSAFTPSRHDLRCLACALQHRPTLGRSALIALLIGTVLTAINQGDVLLRGEWSTALAWKLPLTYAVPFFVATWGALGGARVRPFQLGR
jgi:hypothetical protein